MIWGIEFSGDRGIIFFMTPSKSPPNSDESWGDLRVSSSFLSEFFRRSLVPLVRMVFPFCWMMIREARFSASSR